MAVKTEFKSYVAQTMKLVKEGNEQALIGLGINIASTAKTLAPVDFGQLRNSIQWKTSKTQNGFEFDYNLTGKNGNARSTKREPSRAIDASPKIGELYVGTTVKHGIYQEFGTRNQRPQPFMRPAINKWTKGANAIKSVSNIISKYVSARAKKEGQK